MTIGLTNQRVPVDPRISSAINALEGIHQGNSVDRMTAAIAAADVSDAEQGFHRIKVDDETIERVAFTLGSVYSRGDDFEVRDFMRTARKVLAALAGQPAPPSWGDQVGKVR